MAEWWEEEAFTAGGHAAASAERMSAADLEWRKRAAKGMQVRAEKKGLWLSRQMAAAWMNELLAKGDDREWMTVWRERVFSRLVEEGWFEASLTGQELYRAVETVFGRDRKR